MPKRLVLPKRSPPWRRRFRVGRSKTGLGLFALKPIRRGEFIAYYSGPLITNARADELWTKYLFEVNNRWTVDGSGRRNIARYINHSCKPNAEADVRKHKVFIAAIRTIHPGDEITYNYGKDYFKPSSSRMAAAAWAASTSGREAVGSAAAAKRRKKRLAKKRARRSRLVLRSRIQETPRSSDRP